MIMNDENYNWASATLKEAPFWRDGMTPEEYEQEREYLGKNWKDYIDGKCDYKPLWKQREKDE